AEQALRESRSEVESLRKELALVRVAETNALSAAMRERRAAQESAAELQGAVNRAEKDLDTFRERAEAQLASLSLERDRENICYQARKALAALLEEKSQAEDTAANLVRVGADAQISLESKLAAANEALRTAESRSRTLEADVARAEVDAKECEERAHRNMAETRAAAASASSAAARAAAVRTDVVRAKGVPRRANIPQSGMKHYAEEAERSAAKAATEAAVVERDEAVKAAVADAEVAVREITEELEAARDELKDLRVRERLAREERDSARERLSDAEAAVAKKEKEHVISCQRAESRLESLRLAAEQEELECGAEAALECLLEEKNAAQQRASDLERRLQDAFEAISTTEARADALKVSPG
ncbi:unnamed protein product, partial [Sphacelaria rigidula]